MNEIQVLLIEDSEQDADLILRELRKGGYWPVSKRIETREELSDVLAQEHWDVILCDHVMPKFNSAAALGIVRAFDKNLPFIIVSGLIGEDSAVAAMKMGANDYVMKSNLKRLSAVVQREIADAEQRRERKKAEEELQKKNEELQKKEEELRVAKQIELLKDEFIGMVSHELKTPLTVIIGALNVAEERGMRVNEIRGLIHDAGTSAESLAAMVDNLLELSRHQSNRLSLQKTQTRIEPAIQAVIKKLKDRSSKHQLIGDIPPDLPDALIDPLRIERVLHNLIENAIKYSPKGGEIIVTVHPEDSQLVIGVSDQGIGISPEDKQRLFQKFERLDIQKKYDIAGVGLGLRVCQIIVEAHGGRIWVESELGKGSTFFFTLLMSKS
jgi:signal transduction histidine kinase